MRRAYVLRRPVIPFVPGYAVVGFADSLDEQATPEEVAGLWTHAHSVARRLSRARFGHPDGYSLLFNGARTRRRAWPHVHIILADDVGKKRRAFFMLSLKRLTRPGRWRVFRALSRPLELPPLVLTLDVGDLP